MTTARPFLDLLREHRNGVTHDELSQALQEVVAAVSTEGKAGKLQLTIAVKPHGDGAVMVMDEVKVTVPKKTKGGSLFFVTPENNLARQDPKQPNLPLREIGGADAPREIGPASAGRALA
jgi:type I site-specific restriction endonuclease